MKEHLTHVGAVLILFTTEDTEDAEIPMNRIAAIYGHHGNGKTRILNFVCELIRENEGESLSYFARFNE